MKKSSNKDLAQIALYSALYVVVDLTFGSLMQGEFAHLFPKIIILISSYHLGAKKGFYVALFTIVLDLILGHAHFEAGIWSIVLDYGLVYLSLGSASLIPNQKSFYPGIIIAHIIGFLATLVSRTIAFSITYKAALMMVLPVSLISLVISLIFVPLIVNRLDLTKDTRNK